MDAFFKKLDLKKFPTPPFFCPPTAPPRPPPPKNSRNTHRAHRLPHIPTPSHGRQAKKARMSPFVSNNGSDARIRSGVVNFTRVLGKKMIDRDSRRRKNRREKTWPSLPDTADERIFMATDAYTTHRWEEGDVDADYGDENDYRYQSPVRIRPPPTVCPHAPLRRPANSVWLPHEPKSVGSFYVRDHFRMLKSEGVVDANGNHVPYSTPNKLKRTFAAVLREDPNASPIKLPKLDDLCI